MLDRKGEDGNSSESESSSIRTSTDGSDLIRTESSTESNTKSSNGDQKGKNNLPRTCHTACTRSFTWPHEVTSHRQKQLTTHV